MQNAKCRMQNEGEASLPNIIVCFFKILIVEARSSIASGLFLQKNSKVGCKNFFVIYNTEEQMFAKG